LRISCKRKKEENVLITILFYRILGEKRDGRGERREERIKEIEKTHQT